MNAQLIEPTSIEELREILLESSCLMLIGHGSRLSGNSVAPTASLKNFQGITRIQPEDMTMSVRAGTSLCRLRKELMELSFGLPVAPMGSIGGAYMSDTSGRLLRDSVLGCTFMLADGTVVKSGSSAVKNVAGYDIHRFMAGTRGSLAICLELILRIDPIQNESDLVDAPAETLAVSDPTQIRYMQRAKSIFDPTNKLNPGIWGFM
ncbi:MAG TPA: FAD-binding protein [Fimbriimonadaceae bacterium]|nr:FAD-binding protein [Fimbriimonadaceae bacterium]